MEANQILQSSMLDIIFAGRNKAYGAYQLRKTYNKRLFIALSVMATIILLLFFIRMMAVNKAVKLNREIVVVDSTVLRKLDEEKPIPPPPPPSPKKLQPIATVQFTKIDIVKDEKVLTPPPDNHQIENARIDIKTSEGIQDQHIIAPPSDEKGTQVLYQAPSKKQEEDSPFIRVEIEASFPGGQAAWQRYVTNKIEAQRDEFTDNDFGTCTVRFVVDREGNVSDVTALTMRGTKLAEVAVNAIRKGPKWIPALQNGRYVKAYRLQPVTLLNPNQ